MWEGLALCEWCHSWTSGPESYTKADWTSHRKQTSKQCSSMSSASVSALSSCPDIGDGVWTEDYKIKFNLFFRSYFDHIALAIGIWIKIGTGTRRWSSIDTKLDVPCSKCWDIQVSWPHRQGLELGGRLAWASKVQRQTLEQLRGRNPYAKVGGWS